MYITDFEYANRRLSEFNCIMCSFDGSTGMQDVDIGCDITFNTVKNNHSSVHSKTSSTYENVYTVTFSIMKNPCYYQGDDIYMTDVETRAIIKWLNRHGHYKFKYYNEQFENLDVCYYGSFNIRQKMFGGRVAGLTLTFTANTPYAFGDEIENKINVTNIDRPVVLYCDSDEIGITYPNIKITCLEDGLFEMKNITTGTCLSIDNCIKGETIIMDGEHKLIDTNNQEHKKTLFNDFNYEFIDMETGERSDLSNIYELSMTCELVIAYSPIRKVGVM